jgi:hypothetical protein
MSLLVKTSIIIRTNQSITTGVITMTKFFLIGFLLISIIGLSTIGVMATGMGPDFMSDDNWHMGPGGRHMRNDYDQDGYEYGCHSYEDTDCEGYHSEDCEEFCEENGYEQEDCPRENEDCSFGGYC